MFSSKTAQLLAALEDREIVWLLEGAYQHQAQEYYKYTARENTLLDCNTENVPSSHPGISTHQSRTGELASAIRNAKLALKLAGVLDSILKDVSNARAADFGGAVAEYLKGRDQ